MAPRSGKRKHDAAGGGATVCDETRILDPYALQLPACRLTDHHRKKSKSVTAVRNCAENPNCLFGLGEHHEVAALLHMPAYSIFSSTCTSATYSLPMCTVCALVYRGY